MALSHKSFQSLPGDLLELQLGQVDLLLAMYPEEDSITMSEDSRNLIETLREVCSNGIGNFPLLKAASLFLLLTLNLDHDNAESRIQLDVTVPLKYEGLEPPTEPPQAKIRLRQPSWMSKMEVAGINSKIPENEDVCTIIDHIKDSVTLHLSSSPKSAEELQISKDTPLVRVWFYFPSISTRGKRDDLIRHAPRYGLTGFLFAGKPGILCLEGQSENIDEYMKFIKTESWSDIPAHHKKVSERYRESETGLKRIFVDMQEMTDMVGERRGDRANRLDMKALEAWLGERDLGEAFVKVLM